MLLSLIRKSLSSLSYVCFSLWKMEWERCFIAGEGGKNYTLVLSPVFNRFNSTVQQKAYGSYRVWSFSRPSKKTRENN